MAKSLEQILAEASATVTPKGTRKKRVKAEVVDVVEVAAEPVIGIELGSTVRTRRLVITAGKRAPAGTVGKVVKLHDGMPDWFTVELPTFSINLHRNDLTLQ